MAASLSDEARAALLAHTWPGNVRELKNAIQRARLLCRDGTIRAGRPRPRRARAGRRGHSAEAEPDRAAIEAALARARGVISQAAAELGLSRQALYRRLEKLGIWREARTER